MSEVSVAQLAAAARIVEIASVQNLYNLSERRSQDVLEYAEKHEIGFIPWFPLATGNLTGGDSAAGAIARDRGVSPSQVALAWLLAASPVVLPIPGTSSQAHLRENVAAAAIHPTGDEVARLDGKA
ncbi:aldo/keto reductase [Nocardia araoensis]|uniref:aldo/keto reductase n=1 Tax=Nocardia araoensis TaxID=228600 RepID=UPI001FE14770|nr:aldo/keto reductase [Nocardia araoensis]